MNKGVLVGGGILLGVTVLVAVIAFSGSREILPGGEGDTFNVVQGPLTISVTETGTIQPAEREVIVNELEGNTTILMLIEEGTMVKKGDLLIELDTSGQRDARLDQEIQVRNTEAAYIGAREKLAVEKNLAESNSAQAELDLEFARQDLKKYNEGEYPNSLKQLEAKITLAEEELARAREKLKWSKRLHGEKYISQSELQADELAEKKAALDLDLARNELALLKDFSHQRRQSELQSDVRQAEMAFERINRQGKADVVQAEADLSAKESEFKRQKAKLEKIESQIEKSKIHAPADGQVIYATSVGGGHHWNDDEPLREGRNVREHEELIYLPTTDSVKVELSIHEASLKKVKPGLPVRVSVNAISGKVFQGKVVSIAPLPNTRRAWLNPDLKVYPSEVLLVDHHADLRAGMSCRVEVIVAEYADAIYVPLQCVTRVARQTGVYVLQGGDPEFRPVRIGLDNGRMVRIVEGLKKGELVSMTPSLSASEAAQGSGSRGEEREGKPEVRPGKGAGGSSQGGGRGK